MASLLTGLHHVTALAKDPVENHDFYTRVLGLRLVKKTVNFDDPLTYHLYFGDERGSPGTLLTHFPHPRAKRGVHGSPEILETILIVPKAALPFWMGRLHDEGIGAQMSNDSTERRLTFEDPHGMRFVMIERAASSRPTGYSGNGIEEDRAIAGIDGVVIHVADLRETGVFLRDVLGFESARHDRDTETLLVGDGESGRRIELVETPADSQMRMGAGTVHHVAWRVPDDPSQARVADRVHAAGIPVTPQKDRHYFRSIYFRIPGGVIFEVATDGPGFDVDEPVETLGRDLKLPPQYEPRRGEIAGHLVPLETRSVGA